MSVVDDLLRKPCQLGDFDAEALVGAARPDVVEEGELLLRGDGVHVAVKHVRNVFAQPSDLVKVGGKQADGSDLRGYVPVIERFSGIIVSLSIESHFALVLRVRPFHKLMPPLTSSFRH